MLMLKNKAMLLKQVKNSKTPADVHTALMHNSKIANYAQQKLHLMYDTKSHKYSYLKNFADLSLSVPYDIDCLKNDLSIVIKQY